MQEPCSFTQPNISKNQEGGRRSCFWWKGIPLEILFLHSWHFIWFETLQIHPLRFSFFYLGGLERIVQTVEITKHVVDIEEKGVKLRLTIVDTPGFGDAVNNTEWYVSPESGKEFAWGKPYCRIMGNCREGIPLGISCRDELTLGWRPRLW